MRTTPALFTCLALVGCGSNSAVVPQPSGSGLSATPPSANGGSSTNGSATGGSGGAASPLACVDAPRPFDAAAHPAQVDVTATMHWFDLEGGFWALCGDDGVTYDPLSLPAEYRKEALRVRATLTIRYGMVGTHQVGPLVDLAAISALP